MSTWALVVMVLLVLLAAGIVLAATRRGRATAAAASGGPTVGDLVREREPIAARPAVAGPAAPEPVEPVAEAPAAEEPPAPEPPVERRIVAEEIDAGPVGPPWTRGFVDGVPVESASPLRRPSRRSTVDPALVARVTSVAPPSRDERPVASAIASPAVAEAVARAEAARLEEGATVPAPRDSAARPVLAVVRGGGESRRLRAVGATGGATALALAAESEVDELVEDAPVEVVPEGLGVEVVADAEGDSDAAETADLGGDAAPGAAAVGAGALGAAVLGGAALAAGAESAPSGRHAAAEDDALDAHAAEEESAEDEPAGEDAAPEESVANTSGEVTESDAASPEIAPVAVEGAPAARPADRPVWIEPGAVPRPAAVAPAAAISTPPAAALPATATLGGVSASQPELLDDPADPRAAEHAAVDLALLRTLGFADPNPRPGAAPVVDLHVEHAEPQAEAPAQPVPVRFRVVRRDQQPVGGAAVSLLDPRGRESAAATADDEGRGTVTAPRPGGYVLVTAAQGHQPGVVAVAATAAGADVELQVVRSSSVCGTVREGGSPFAGAIVSLLQDGELVAEAVSDPSGGFRFTELAAGDYTVALVAAEHETRVSALAVAEEADDRHDLALGPVPAPHA